MAEYRKAVLSKEYRDSTPTIPAHYTRKCSLKVSDISEILKNQPQCAGQYDKSCKEREITDEDAKNFAKLYKKPNTSFDNIDFDTELLEILESTVNDDHQLNKIKPKFQKSAPVVNTEVNFPAPVFGNRNVGFGEVDCPPKKVAALESQTSHGKSSLMDKIDSAFRNNTSIPNPHPVKKAFEPEVNASKFKSFPDRQPVRKTYEPEVKATGFKSGKNDQPFTSVPEPPTIELSRNPCPDFNTATHVYNVQNLKKSQATGYQPVKPLGLSRTTNSIVRQQFKSPQQTSEEKQGSTKVEEDSDPLLKGIEPHLLEIIKSEVVDQITGVDWDQIAGLDGAKQTIQEAVMLPLLHPQLFVGLRTVPKGILLFGPPGKNFSINIFIIFNSI